MKVAYNDKKLNILRNKHIAQLKKTQRKLKVVQEKIFTK